MHPELPPDVFCEDREMAELNFICRTCGQTHEGIPLSFAADYPDMYANMPEIERATRAIAGSDRRIID